MSSEDLHSMKYADLQKLAKAAGIRANQKIDKLIQALLEHNPNSDENEMTDDTETEQYTSNESQLEDSLETNGDKSSATVLQTPNNRKRRRRTFELEEATLKGDSTPVIESEEPQVISTRLRKSKTPQSETQNHSAKRLRKDTFDKQSSSDRSGGSLTTQSILDSVSSECSSAERKERLLSAIDKKVQMKMKSSPAYTLKNQSSQIPRFMAFLSKKKEEQTVKTPGGKNWTKIHKKEFSKFDSIDVYLDKKTQRKENLSSSSKKLPANKSSTVKPHKHVTKPEIRSQETEFFKPTVISTKNIDFNFSKLASDSKTPTKPRATPSRKQISATKKVKEIGSTTKAPASLFKFTGNTVTLGSSKKPVFDLKASLAKPLSWKPHTGKLNPVDINTHTLPSVSNNTIASRPIGNKSQTNTNRKAKATASRDPSNRMKNRQQAKDVRRAVQLDRRSNQKYVDMMKRRGLMA